MKNNSTEYEYENFANEKIGKNKVPKFKKNAGAPKTPKMAGKFKTYK